MYDMALYLFSIKTAHSTQPGKHSTVTSIYSSIKGGHTFKRKAITSFKKEVGVFSQGRLIFRGELIFQSEFIFQSGLIFWGGPIFGHRTVCSIVDTSVL